MKLYAHFQSINTEQGLKTFRYETTFHSENGPGTPIGLVYMLNPGSSRPICNCLFTKLQTSEFSTENLVEISKDPTMSKVINCIKAAYEHNGMCLPDKYSIHIENLFNLREPISKDAKKLANKLAGIENLMFKSRKLNSDYQFVWLAWGNTEIKKERQQEIIAKYPNAIKVQKFNCKGTIHTVDYPLHPLYTNKRFFLEAAKGKIRCENNL